MGLRWLLPTLVAGDLLSDFVCLLTGCYSGKCADLCLECTGPQVMDCSRCVQGAELTQGECLCSSRSFAEGNACTPCHSSCATCSGALETQCDSCAAGMTLDGGRCECPSGTYWGSKDCQSCHETCNTCYGPSKYHCTGCKAAATLHNTRCSCQSGYYPNPHSGNCTACHPSCVSCSGPEPTQCRECQPHALLFSGMCMCKEGFYSRNDSDCLGCHETCRSCSGPTALQCLDCRPGAINWGGECACAQGYSPFPDSSQCRPCLSTCQAPGNCPHPSQKLTKRIENPTPKQRKIAEIMCDLENTHREAPGLAEIFALDIMDFPSEFGNALIVLLHSRTKAVYSKGLELLYSSSLQAFTETVIFFVHPQKRDIHDVENDYSPGNVSILSLDNWAMVDDLVYPYQVLRRFVVAEEDGTHIQVVELPREAASTLAPKKLLLEHVYFSFSGKRIRLDFA